MSTQKRVRDIIALRLWDSEAIRPWPWRAWRLKNLDGEERIFIFTAEITTMVKAPLYVCIHILDKQGALIDTSLFSSGRRIRIESVSLRRSRGVQPILEIASNRGRGGQDIAKQFYGFVGDDFR
ncbi:MAG: hypothetical protein QF473_34500, partial [Planctomycetota bacterium]|nr:hypothetical protein [Planctomycetota bacterium]